MTVDTSTAVGSSADGRTDTTERHARATVRPDKAGVVAELTESFRSASATVLTEYRGLTVKQVTDLRVALGANTTYSVVKNTLTRLAASGAGLAGLESLLVGPTAVAFVNGDPVEAAKALRDYARANPALVVKGGVLDGKTLSADEVRKLADLESREVLLAKFAGAMKASLTQAVYLLAAPLAQTARLAAALQAKAEEDPSVLAGGAGTPAPAAEADTTTDVPADTAADTGVPGTPDADVTEAAQSGAVAADASPESGVSDVDTGTPDVVADDSPESGAPAAAPTEA